MSTLSLNLPGTATPGTASAVPNQDVNKTFLYTNGGPLDQTDIEGSQDGINWVKISAVRQVGSSWTVNVPGKYANVRLNRITVDLSSAAIAFVAANDIVPAANQGPLGPNALGQLSIASNVNANVNTVVPTAIATFGTQADGCYQVEIDLVYRNLTTFTVGSRKVTGTVRRLNGVLAIEAQQNPSIYLNDNAAFGANINTVLAVSSTSIQLLVNSVGSALNVDWTASGVINFVQ